MAVDGRRPWETVADGPSLECVGQGLDKTRGTIEYPLSLSLILTCWATLDNDRRGYQTAIPPRPGSAQTDSPVVNTVCNKSNLISHPGGTSRWLIVWFIS